MSDFVTYIVAAMIIIGTFFSLTAALGIVRLPDVYSRMHAASKGGALGSGFMLVAIAIKADDLGTATRALAGVAFFLMTAPISAHLLAKAAYAVGYRLSDMSVINEMDKK